MTGYKNICGRTNRRITSTCHMTCFPLRSLLDGSDAVSIDPAVVSSQEFACLLDMIYTGKLPLGKHNVSRIIAAADTLQMFDVAVGFKNVLSTLVPSAQTPTAPPGSTPHGGDTPPPPHTDASHHTQLELQPKEEEGRSDGTPPPPACKRTCPEHSESSGEFRTEVTNKKFKFHHKRRSSRRLSCCLVY